MSEESVETTNGALDVAPDPSFPPFGENLYDAEGNPMVVWDFTNNLRVEYNSDGTTTSRPFTDEELAMVADKQAATQAVDNREALLVKAAQALTNNATFLAIASPTQAQAVTQVKALTRQVNALIRMQLGDTADISDT